MGVLEWVRAWLYGTEPMVPKKVRELSHKQANETLMLRYNLRKIAEAADPIDELVRIMRAGK